MLQTRKGGSLPKGTWNTLWQCETRALLSSKTGQGVHGGRVVNSSSHLLIMKCVHHTAGRKPRWEGKFTGCWIISLTKLELCTHMFISRQSMTQCLCAARDMRAGVSLVKRSLPHGQFQLYIWSLPQSDAILLNSPHWHADSCLASGH